jgi:succinate dehydrogenase / fumarate reductase, cytochrome b subunit
MAKSAFLKSSITKKYWMALTGLFLCLFLVGHLLGNLQLLAGDNIEGALQFNKYALFMTTNPAVKLLSYVTYISIIFHAIDGIYLTIQNKKARPLSYAMSNPSKNSSYSSRNMAVLGTLVLIFIATHMINFWAKMHFDENMPLVTKEASAQTQGQMQLIGTPDSKIPSIPLPSGGSLKKLVEENNKQPNNPDKLILEGSNVVKSEKTGEVLFIGFKDLHKLTYAFFKSDNKLFGAIPKEGLLFVIFYVLSMIALAFHLWHGFQSAFQSLGVNGKFTPAIKMFGKTFSIIVPVLFAIIPIFIRFIAK